MDTQTGNQLYHGEMRIIDLDHIIVNPFQPRHEFAIDDLKDLADSIQAVGILHPPLVRQLEEEDRYELISGERRCRAARLAGMKKIPVYIRTTSVSISAQAALIENVQRVDLNAIEIAKSLKELVDAFGFNQEALAQRIGKKRSTVANYLRLLTLPKSIQESVSKNIITMGHAKAILAFETSEKQLALHEIVLRDRLTVRETEERTLQNSKKKNIAISGKDKSDIYLNEIVQRIQERCGTKVTISGKGNSGKISIDYYNLDDLDRLLKVFGVEGE